MENEKKELPDKEMGKVAGGKEPFIDCEVVAPITVIVDQVTGAEPDQNAMK